MEHRALMSYATVAAGFRTRPHPARADRAARSVAECSTVVAVGKFPFLATFATWIGGWPDGCLGLCGAPLYPPPAMGPVPGLARLLCVSTSLQRHVSPQRTSATSDFL